MARTTHGIIFIHCAPPAMIQHIEWAVQSVLGYEIPFQWNAQPASPPFLRCEIAWVGQPGTGTQLASSLHGWEHVRYEITEEHTATSEGGRWSYTPSLGIFYAQTDLAGNIVVSENRVRAALEKGGDDPTQLREALNLALGKAWDDELEPYRYAGAGASVRVLRHLG